MLRALIRSPYLWTAVAVILFVAVRMITSHAIHFIPANGDERYQFAIVKHGFDINRGSFLPGIGIYLSGFRYFWGNIPLEDARVIVGVTNSLLFAVAFALIARTMGIWSAIAFTIVMSFCFEWNLMAWTLWGEHAGSVLLVINFLFVYWLTDAIVAGRRVPVWAYLALLIIFGISLYVRQNFMIFPVIALVLSSLAFAVVYFRDRKRNLRVFMVPLVYAVGLLFLTPWTMALSKHVGGFRVAPVSQDISLAIHYGYKRLMPMVRKKIVEHHARTSGKTREEIDESEFKGNSFLVVHRAARYQSRDEHRPLLDIFKEYREYALKGLTLNHAIVEVQDAWQRFLFGAGKFGTSFFEMQYWRLDAPVAVRALLQTVYSTIYVTAFALSFAVAVIPFWGTLREQLLVIAFKGTFLFACLNPFVHRTNARHHQFVVPLMVVGALLLFRECYRLARTSSYSDMAAAEKALFFLQAAGGLAILSLALVIALYPA